MTDAPNSIADLKLLREAPLPSGFEERLRERLVAVASEKKVVRLSSRKSHRGLLLLAAIALPVAAFAAGGVWMAQRFSAPERAAAPTADAPRPPKALPTAPSLPAVSPAPALSEPKVEPVLRVEPRKATIGSVSPRGQQGAAPVQTESTTERAESAPAPATEQRGPAKIESLDVTLPKRSGAASPAGSGSGAAKSSELRRAADHGASDRSFAEREGGSQSREQAAERRGSDATEQSRERVQARERKGQ